MRWPVQVMRWLRIEPTPRKLLIAGYVAVGVNVVAGALDAARGGMLWPVIVAVTVLCIYRMERFRGVVMKWFGKDWGAAVTRDCPHVDTPVGVPCGRCGEGIADGDNGLIVPHLDGEKWSQRPYHYACHMRAVIGGVNHMLGKCTCCGGTEPPDPPEMSKREAAEAAVAMYEQRQRWVFTRECDL